MIFQKFREEILFIYFFSFKFVKLDFKNETIVSLSLNFYTLLTMNIYVGNLNFRVKEPQLQEVFEAFGEVTLVKVIRNKETGRSKGFAFVEMSNDEQATTAIETLSNSEFEGRRMIVAQARPKPEKTE